MYSYHKNVQIILALLKKFGIRNIVASAGTRQISLAFSAVQDDFFHCYSIVDERSAAFFALGLIQTTKEPCAIVCTSGTAAANYASAINEAYYQHLPLVVLTSDRNRIYLNQQEDQCIPQVNLYQDVLKKAVDLPIVKDELDEWYCARLVNEALLELNHREPGPVHINYIVVPVYPKHGGDFLLDQKRLPDVKKISRVMADDDIIHWKDLANRMNGKKIMILFGQNLPIGDKETKHINDFASKYNVVIAAEHIANRYTEYQIANMNILNMVNWDVMHPDIVITMGGHRMLEFKPTFRKLKNKMEHWHVSPNGEVSDPYFCQTDIIECKQDFFFRRMSELAQKSNHSYYEEWATVEKRLLKQQPKAEDFDFSAVYAIKKLIENLPSKSLFHISNSDSIRISSSFLLPKNINVYCNRGTCGIDGSMSTYVAQSYVTNRPSFLVIGDLSFFYDMNGLWNHYINKNTRIMLINNGGGAILNFGAYKTVNVPNKLPNTAASHNVSAKGWVESIGFTYFAARTEEEFNSVMPKFVSSDSDTPILLEVYTKMDDDINERGKILSSYKSSSEQTKDSMKKIIAQPIKGILKGIVKRD